MPLRTIIQTGPTATPAIELGRYIRQRAEFRSGLFHGGPRRGDTMRLSGNYVGTLYIGLYRAELQLADYFIWSGSTPVGWHVHPRGGWTVIPENVVSQANGPMRRHRRLVIAALLASGDDTAPVRPVHPPWQGDGDVPYPNCGQTRESWSCTRPPDHRGWHEAWYSDLEETEPVYAWSPGGTREWARP